MLFLSVMVFQKRLTHFLVWVTCDSAEEKNVAAQPHPPTNQVQTCIFQIPLGEALKLNMSAKIPEWGGGFHFLAHGLMRDAQKLTQNVFPP